jgi:hypothetical protein
MLSSKQLASLLLFAISALPVVAQTDSAKLDGTVQDQSGAVVPNANVVAVNTHTQRSSRTTADGQGHFVLPALQPGIYQLSVDAPGFRKAVINALELNVDSTVSQIVKLEVGQATESVVVEAENVAVQTGESQIGRVINMKDIDTLPQLARTPLTLAIFASPGVQVFQQGSSAGTDTSYSHINGLRSGSNNNTLDGIDVNDSVAPRLGLSLTASDTDSVGEFRVITEGGKAEYGRNAGGQVELITRSGTNQYHGNLFDYLRNTDLTANDFFSNSSNVARPLFIQNIFGGSMGAPIKHNKLFIFGNYQGRRTHQQIVRNRIVPTDLAKQGIFQWKPAGGAVQQYNIVTNDPRGKGIDPYVASLLKLYPSPNNNDVGDGLNSAGFRFNNPNGSLEDQFTIKADYNMTAAQHIFFRQSWERNSSIDSLNSADAPFPGEAQGTQGGKRWGVAAGWDWTLTTSIVNEFRYGHQSATTDFVRPERVAGPMISQNPLNDNWFPPVLPSYAQGRNSPVNEWTDNITKIHGSHTFKAGFNMRFTTQFGYNDANIYPNINLSTANGNAPPASATPPGNLSPTDLTTFQGMYNNLLGRVSQISQTFYSNLQMFQAAGTPRVRNFVFHEYGFFFQDDWKATRNLTLNVGLRWEFLGVPFETNGISGSLDQVASLNTVSQIDNLTIKKGAQWYNNDWNNFAPRFGFSWDPKGDGKMAVRGGFGIFYDRNIGSTANGVDGNTPGFTQSVPVFPNVAAGSDVRISDNPALPAQPGAPVLTLPATRSTSAIVFNPNLRTGYVPQWSLTVQREIARNTVIEAGYVGNRGVKLYYNEDLNQPRIYGDFLQSFQQLQAYVANKSSVPPASNTLVRIFGSPDAAVTAIGSSTLTTGQVRLAADTVDQNNYTKYAAAGISQFYLRNYPQYFQLVEGTNDGRSYYNSFQLSLRRQVGALRMTANYTRSKSMDNVLSTATSGEGNGFSEPIDNYNAALGRARSNFDIPNVFTFSSAYTLPVGKGHAFGADMPKWANTLVGGWDLGGLMIWDSGSPFTVVTSRLTGPSDQLTTTGDWANYTGSRNIGSVSLQGNGVYFFTPAQIANFSYPVAGDIGNSGRNAFRGPRYFNIDMSLVKRFAITEKHALVFRAEAYNVINNVNFANPGLNLAIPAGFGKISSVVGNARFLQMALRYEF